MDKIDVVKLSYDEELRSLPNVLGVAKGKKITNGVQTDEEAILILVKKKKPIERSAIKRFFLRRLHPHDAAPAQIEGVKTDVIQSGKIVAFQDPRIPWRPAPGGVSIGHYLVTAGTAGATVIDNETGLLVTLSNNHVLANSNEAEVGDPVYQPGTYDGGNPSYDMESTLRWIPIGFTSSACPIGQAIIALYNGFAKIFGRRTRLQVESSQSVVNTVDCALGLPHNQEDLRLDILVIGQPKAQTVEAVAGMKVRKFGRTTEYTEDKVIGVDATVQVGYGKGTAVFQHQIIAGPMSAGGDSGSLVLDMENHPVGLLFAGSEEVTICNDIRYVIDALNISFVE